MKKALTLRLVVIMCITLLFTSCRKDIPVFCECEEDDIVATVRVFATGLNNPRGLKFGPDGYLYVAEGGLGGTNSTAGLCTQVIPPVGPYTGSQTGGRISRISHSGVRTTVTDRLPSSQTSPALGGEISGVADIAFIGKNMYALLSGAGCSHGVKDIPNGVVKINKNGSWTMIADLSAYQKAHPVKNPEEDDFEPDGSWYSMISVKNNLYAVEPNHGEIVKITPSGNVSRLVDVSASQGHIVPTVLGYNGNFFFGNLHVFPIVPGASKIYKLTPGGEIKVWASGFNTILGVMIDKKGRLLVLENTVGAPFPTPGLGRITAVDRAGNKKIVVSGLSLPTGITAGPDGKIYVSNWGFGPTAKGGGQVLQIELKCKDNDDKRK